jgi:threonine synthase
MAWHAFARAHGMTAAACEAIVLEIDNAVQAFAGVGFHVTPFARHDALSDALGFASAGGVWIKDETGNVGGSHKARHLFAILLHLVVAERLGVAPTTARPRLAIASCGNAAIAAATLAGAVAWPIDVFVPPWAKRAVRDRLAALGANIVTCPRLADDPPGDPCIHRFREAVNSGSVPFSVQGPENALCLDGGRTLGIEIGLQSGAAGVGLDTVFAQTGGGAFATGIGDGLHESLGTRMPKLLAVQAAGCAPLVRAAVEAKRFGAAAPSRWRDVMWPWETEPDSLATGILDDETYDWIGVLENVERSGGSVIAVDEPLIARALELISTTTTIQADATSTAGLAGLLKARSTIDDRANVAIVVSGIRRE